MRRAALILVLLLVGHARPALADDTSGRELSPNKALALSLVPTLGGIALTAWGSSELPATGPSEEIVVATGLVIANIGPTLGNIYARDVWNPGLATRAIGTGIGLVGLVMVARSRCVIECGRGGKPDLLDAGVVVMVAGGLTYVSGAAIEVVNSYRAANAHNARLAAERPSIAIVPLVRPESAGLGIVGTF